MSIEEAAKFLLVSPHTVTNWRYQGRGPRFVKYGGMVFYRLVDLEHFVASNVVDPSTGIKGFSSSRGRPLGSKNRHPDSSQARA